MSSIPSGLAEALEHAGSAADRGLVLLKAAIAEYAGEHLGGVDNANLLADIVSLHTQSEALHSAWLSRIAEADRREAAAEEEGATSTASWLRASCLIPGPVAANAVRVARRLRDLPRTAEALAEGRIGFDAARLLTRTLTQSRLQRAAAAGMTAEALDVLESALVDVAELTDPVKLRGELAKVVEHLDAAPTADDAADSPAGGEAADLSELYASKTLDDVVHVSGRFDALDGAALLTALDAASAPTGPEDKRTAAQRRAAALIEVITLALNGGHLPTNGGERPHIGVLVPYETLAGAGAADDTGATNRLDDVRLPDSAPHEVAPAPHEVDPAPHEVEPGDASPHGVEPAGADVVRFIGVEPILPAGDLTPTTPGNIGTERYQSCTHLDRLLGDLHSGIGIGIGSTAWLTRTGPISAETARLLACDSIVHRIILSPDSIPLDVGRNARIVPAPLRRALLVRDGGCAFPGCDRPPSWCEAHHINHWADGGETSLDNCVLLCAAHHKLIHYTGWEVHAVPGGRPYFTRPGGIRYHGPRIPRAG